MRRNENRWPLLFERWWDVSLASRNNDEKSILTYRRWEEYPEWRYIAQNSTTEIWHASIFITFIVFRFLHPFVKLDEIVNWFCNCSEVSMIQVKQCVDSRWIHHENQLFFLIVSEVANFSIWHSIYRTPTRIIYSGFTINDNYWKRFIEWKIFLVPFTFCRVILCIVRMKVHWMNSDSKIEHQMTANSASIKRKMWRKLYASIDDESCHAVWNAIYIRMAAVHAKHFRNGEDIRLWQMLQHGFLGLASNKAFFSVEKMGLFLFSKDWSGT